ncbi:hypothetical protein HaLaN_14825 [Haematococcus lacustris]|uniref:Uncharacterized protein n=1 Tax=Haematococcus lacustris TaxID=44745 RepID=A0A699ZQA1_HAELA|nr:hypothetical protein HaLaN_14825 [Haematococcus lacustris]
MISPTTRIMQLLPMKLLMQPHAVDGFDLGFYCSDPPWSSQELGELLDRMSEAGRVVRDTRGNIKLAKTPPLTPASSSTAAAATAHLDPSPSSWVQEAAGSPRQRAAAAATGPKPATEQEAGGVLGVSLEKEVAPKATASELSRVLDVLAAEGQLVRDPRGNLRLVRRKGPQPALPPNNQHHLQQPPAPALPAAADPAGHQLYSWSDQSTDSDFEPDSPVESSAWDLAATFPEAFFDIQGVAQQALDLLQRNHCLGVEQVHALMRDDNGQAHLALWQVDAALCRLHDEFEAEGEGAADEAEQGAAVEQQWGEEGFMEAAAFEKQWGDEEAVEGTAAEQQWGGEGFLGAAALGQQWGESEASAAEQDALFEHEKEQAVEEEVESWFPSQALPTGAEAGPGPGLLEGSPAEALRSSPQPAGVLPAGQPADQADGDAGVDEAGSHLDSPMLPVELVAQADTATAHHSPPSATPLVAAGPAVDGGSAAAAKTGRRRSGSATGPGGAAAPGLTKKERASLVGKRTYALRRLRKEFDAGNMQAEEFAASAAAIEAQEPPQPAHHFFNAWALGTPHSPLALTCVEDLEAPQEQLSPWALASLMAGLAGVHADLHSDAVGMKRKLQQLRASEVEGLLMMELQQDEELQQAHSQLQAMYTAQQGQGTDPPSQQQGSLVQLRAVTAATA